MSPALARRLNIGPPPLILQIPSRVAFGLRRSSFWRSVNFASSTFSLAKTSFSSSASLARSPPREHRKRVCPPILHAQNYPEIIATKSESGRVSPDERPLARPDGLRGGGQTGRRMDSQQLMGTTRFLSSLFSMTDEQAMWRVQTEDDYRAFARLVERWEEPVRRLCARMTGDPHRGEDLKQETFARVFERRKAFRPNARFSTWVWRIALNLCYDELRRVHRRGESPLDPDETEGLEVAGEWVAEAPGPDTQLAEREEGELVRAALVRLPEIYRTVLVLRHYENLKLREIAEVLEIPEGTVNSRLAEGLARLTRLLEPRLDHPPGRRHRMSSGTSGGCEGRPGDPSTPSDMQSVLSECSQRKKTVSL